MSASGRTSSSARAWLPALHGATAWPPAAAGKCRTGARRVSAFVCAGPYNAEPDAGPGQPVRALALAVRGTARAKVAELEEALDLGSSGGTLERSRPSFRTPV